MPKSKSKSRALAAPPVVVTGKLTSRPATQPSTEKPSGSKMAMPAPTASAVVKHPYAQMMIDPLGGPLSGRPDSAMGATLLYRTKDVYDITTNSVGAAALAVHPGTGGGTFSATITAGTSTLTAWAAGSVSSGDAEIVAFPFSRVLAYVVEWFPTASVMNESGMATLVLRNMNSGYPETGSLTVFQDDDASISANTSNSAVVAVRPTDTPAFASGTSSAVRAYLPTTVFVITGGQASAVVGKIRVTRVIEVLPNSGTLVASGAVNHGCSHCVLECVTNAGATRASTSAVAASPASAWKQVVAGGMKALGAAVKAYATGDMSSIVSMLN